MSRFTQAIAKLETIANTSANSPGFHPALRDQAQRALAAMSSPPSTIASRRAAMEREVAISKKASSSSTTNTKTPIAKTPTRAELAAIVNRQVDELLERKDLIASRSDLPAETRKTMADLPLATVKTLVKSLPRASQQAGVTASGYSNDSGHGEWLDRRTGLYTSGGGVRNEGDRLILSSRRASGPKAVFTPTNHSGHGPEMDRLAELTSGGAQNDGTRLVLSSVRKR